MFEIERVRDRERKIGYSLHKGTETLVRDREKFEIEGVRDRESRLYASSPITYIIIKKKIPKLHTLLSKNNSENGHA